jgi:SPOR domain
MSVRWRIIIILGLALVAGPIVAMIRMAELPWTGNIGSPATWEPTSEPLPPSLSPSPPLVREDAAPTRVIGGSAVAPSASPPAPLVGGDSSPAVQPKQVAEASEPQLGVATATIESSQSGVKKLPTLDDTWVVQLLAQRTEAQTQAEFRRMQTKYSALGSYQLLIRKKDQGNRGVFYAAQVGPLPREEANQLCENLKRSGGSCFIQRNDTQN